MKPRLPSALDQIEVDGLRKPIGAWAAQISNDTGELYKTVLHRIQYRIAVGHDPADAIMRPGRGKKDTSVPWDELATKIRQYFGSIRKAARHIGVSDTLYRDYMTGYAIPNARVGNTIVHLHQLVEDLASQ